MLSTVKNQNNMSVQYRSVVCPIIYVFHIAGLYLFLGPIRTDLFFSSLSPDLEHISISLSVNIDKLKMNNITFDLHPV